MADSSQWPFRSVLIANRGEIALRIARTVRALGLETVALYHAEDRDSELVRTADRAVEIIARTPVAAYLDAEQIVSVARALTAGAVHPGYGFLSENADFARRVTEAGLVFVGPPPDVIELMGDKIRARAFVAGRGFPVAPSATEDDDPATFHQRAGAIGFPVLIKPAAGGGGKGMRIVRDPSSLPGEIERARNEGQRYFGDGRLYVERYVENPRHIEVQVLGDAHGQVVHVFERECSVQRRFQKIVEESPSPALDEALRLRICEAAAGIARAAGYRNAGTVEFVYGGGEFYFLEMNTRLQVEHPVTEMVTGLDLVREQLRLAAGEPLGYRQNDISTIGHAIELRIYAESPGRGFSPTTGSVLALRLPAGEGIRIDAGICENQRVTTAFDPMLLKLIVRDENREAARQRARSALRELALLGCETNAAFLQRLLDHPAFVNGEIHTGFLDVHPEIATEPPIDRHALLRVMAAAALSSRPVREAADLVPELYAAMGAWRN